MTTSERVLALLKLGARSHLEQFAQGTLYMNTLQYFSEVEESLLRRDCHEGASYSIPSAGTTFSIKVDGCFVPINGLTGPILFRNETDWRVNVFCMHALREHRLDSNLFIDERNLGFGDSFALVLEPEEFLERVKVAVSKIEDSVEWELVEYVDESSFHGPLGIFKKFSAFSYQSEFRIALSPGSGESRTLSVGDLSDIVMLGDSSDLNKRLSMRLGEAGQRGLQIRNL